MAIKGLGDKKTEQDALKVTRLNRGVMFQTCQSDHTGNVSPALVIILEG